MGKKKDPRFYKRSLFGVGMKEYLDDPVRVDVGEADHTYLEIRPRNGRVEVHLSDPSLLELVVYPVVSNTIHVFVVKRK